MTESYGVFKKRYRTYHDLLLFSLLLCLLFVIGHHIGAPDRQEQISFLLSMSEYGNLREDDAYPPSALREGQVLAVDGKWEITYIGCSGGLYQFFCRGYLTPSGFLLSGAKYLSENQPITVTAKELCFRGKIMRLSKI